MTTAIRLPVAPRAFRDELLSSWMARVAACHGLDVPEMTAYLAGQGGNTPDLRQIDDMNPDPVLLGLWAEACRIDPARLWRRSLMEWMPPSLTASRCAKLGVLWPKRMEGGIHEGS